MDGEKIKIFNTSGVGILIKDAGTTNNKIILFLYIERESKDIIILYPILLIELGI